MTGGVSLGAGPKLGAKIYGGGGSAKWFCKGGVFRRTSLVVHIIMYVGAGRFARVWGVAPR